MKIWIPFLVLILGIQASPLVAVPASTYAAASIQPLGAVVRLAQQTDDLDCEDFDTQ
jgi:hypothetical protein